MLTESSGILLRSGEPFTTGASGYLDAYPGRVEPLARIYVRLQLEGTPTEFLALFDTGAHYCLLNEETARIARRHLTSPLGEVTLRTAYGPVCGELFIHRLRFVADEGESLEVESTIFLPPGWQAPSVLGYTGALDRVRHGLDPVIGRFYYGPAG